MKRALLLATLLSSCSGHEKKDSTMTALDSPWVYGSGNSDFQNLKQALTPYSEAKRTGRYNILFRGLDNESRRSIPGADSLVVLSVNINPDQLDTHAPMTVFSIPRDDTVCYANNSSTDKITDYFAMQGYDITKSRISCIEDALTRAVNGSKSELADSEGQLKIHDVFQGTFSDAKKGIGSFGATETITEVIKGALSNPRGAFELKNDFDNGLKDKLRFFNNNKEGIFTFLRERYDFDATGGAYQRAMNHSRFITYMLGYSSYIYGKVPKGFRGIFAKLFEESFPSRTFAPKELLERMKVKIPGTKKSVDQFAAATFVEEGCSEEDTPCSRVPFYLVTFKDIGGRYYRGGYKFNALLGAEKGKRVLVPARNNYATAARTNWTHKQFEKYKIPPKPPVCNEKCQESAQKRAR